MYRALLPLALGACLLGACASAPPEVAPAPPRPVPAPAPAASAPPAAAPAPEAIRYRCDHGVEFTVRYGTDAAVVDAGQQGRDELLRDAGGVTPQQTVYSNERLRAEFGLGGDGREAVLNYAEPPLVAHCQRE